jgi:FAD:protein FMN transferase
MTAHVVFPAIGTKVFVAVRDLRDLPAAERLARRVIADVDATCSRFRDDSDLARVNRSPGRWVAVDPLLVAAVEVACLAAARSEGLVHPLLGRPLVELGYDRDFGLLTETHAEAVPVTAPPLESWRDIRLTDDGVLIPDGTALDLGATGKAWCADLIATAFERNLRGSAVVSVGGDVRIARPDGRPWRVAVSEHPDRPPAETIAMRAGAVATSTTRVRRWTRHGVRRHHLLDPRTGLPAPEVWRTVTAVAETCVAANTATTAAVVLGTPAPVWLGSAASAARLVHRSGRVHRLGSWPRQEVAA